MATTRPPSGGTPNFRIGVDFSVLRAAPGTARGYAQATAREISQAFRTVQNEQRLLLEQARQTTVALRTQQSQVSAAARAESAQRIAMSRAEAAQQQQAARVASAAAIEEERRKTAAFRAELRQRERAQRTSGFAAGGFGQLAGALGVGLGASQILQAVVAGERQATMYERQFRAATRLAGGQQQLNELLEAYRRATGGIISDAVMLQRVLELQATGFADNAAELERFTLATRGSAMASGRPQEQVAFFAQMEILNATNLRLNEIGLSYEEVERRTEELRRTTRGLTADQIRQEAIVGLLIDKYGELAKEPATPLEELGKTWANQTLAISRATSGVVDFMATGLNEWLLTTQQHVEFVRNRWQDLNDTIRNTGPLLRAAAAGGVAIPTAGWRGGSFAGGGSAGGFGGGGGTGGFGGSDGAVSTGRFQGTADQQIAQQGLVTQRWMALGEVTRNSNRALLEAQTQYETQRSRTISQFERSRSEEAADFARKRLNDERRHNMALLDVAQDSARQRARWEADTARQIEESRAERDERIAEAREDSAERIADIEDRFNRDREKRQRSHAEALRDAAANLDAVQVRELQRQQREENEEAERARDEQIADERESLQERIDEANKAFAKQEADQRAALQRRINLQAEDDRLRIEEMQAAFEEQKAQEDIERGIRLERQAAHHQAQLEQMDTEHAADIQQIKDHAQDERDQIEEEFQTAMIEAGARLKAWEDYLKQRENAANASFDRVYGHMLRRFNETVATGHPSLADPYANLPLPSVAPVTNNSATTRSNTVNVHPNAINVVAPPNMALDERTAAWFMGLLVEFFEDNYPQ